MTNKKLGNAFEREFADTLSEHGFWVHLLNQNQDGQPADIIAVKNKRAYLIDCKVCSTQKGFTLTRIEENQDLAMMLWKSCGNGEGWFALRIADRVYMIPHVALQICSATRKTLSPGEIAVTGIPLEMWVESC